jgi:hypothetical protein
VRNEIGVNPLKTSDSAKWLISNLDDLNELRPSSRSDLFRLAKQSASFSLIWAVWGKERNESCFFGGHKFVSVLSVKVDDRLAGEEFR